MAHDTKEVRQDLGKLVTLRELQKGDLEIIRKWRNENRQFFFTQTEITPEMQINWYIKRYVTNPDDTIFVVFYENIPVGTLAIIKRGNDFELGRVMLGEKKYKRHGIMGGAVEKLLANYETKNKNQRIFLEVLKGNKSATSFYEKHGFLTVGENEKEFIMERYV